MADRRLLVLYSTVTGNAEDVAERVGREALRRGWRPRVESTAALRGSLEDLRGWPVVVWVVSTTGQGEAPPTLRALWRALLARALPADWLAGRLAAVFGLGDSGYAQYNVAGKKLYRRLEQLGAGMLGAAGLGDDRAPGGYEAALGPWLTGLWTHLRAAFPAPEGVQEADPTDRFTQPSCKWRVRVGPMGPPAGGSGGSVEPPLPSLLARVHAAFWALDEAAGMDVQASAGTAQLLRNGVDGADLAAASSTDPTSVDAGAPAPAPCARLVQNRRLTAEDHWQEVRHLDFELAGEQYEPGDVLSVLPQQDWQAVCEVLTGCGVHPSSEVVLSHLARLGQELVCTAGELVAAVLDVAAGSPRRTFFEVLREHAGAPTERERLEYFCSGEGAADLAAYNQLEGRTMVEVLADFSSARPSLDWVLSSGPKLAPREFSISSSPLAHPGHVHLTLAVVSWVTPYKRRRRGLCSTWLAGLRPGVAVPVRIKPGALRLPADPATPIICVGPGTGVAPMRAFIHHRAAQRAAGGVCGPCLLFFGCRNAAKDWLYAEEWEELTRAGVLTGQFLAASRDQAHKIYVQDRIRGAGAQVATLLTQQGAWMYVAGSADKMPADVAAAVAEVLQAHGGASQDDALRAIRLWQARGRYQVEAWT